MLRHVLRHFSFDGVGNAFHGLLIVGLSNLGVEECVAGKNVPSGQQAAVDADLEALRALLAVEHIHGAGHRVIGPRVGFFDAKQRPGDVQGAVQEFQFAADFKDLVFLRRRPVVGGG